MKRTSNTGSFDFAVLKDSSANHVSRRAFLRSAALGGGSALLLASPPSPLAAATSRRSRKQPAATSPAEPARLSTLNLVPARWLWYPADRTLPNTFILFRRTVHLSSPPRTARGWIYADSWYLLELNGRRVQWGPARCDPRWPEVDPVDLADKLTAGENVLGATVLFYGHGDGTWPMGKPGFIFRLEIEHADGRKELVVSDAGWRCRLARSWQPGMPKRGFLRAVQEVFDARLYPHGWQRPAYRETDDWLAPAILNGIGVSEQDAAVMHLRPRSIPLMREEWIPVTALREQHRIEWLRPVDEYFEMRPPQAYRASAGEFASALGAGSWSFELDWGKGTTLTFDLPEQGVGWPGFTVEAPNGTVIELMTHEAHAVGGPALLNTGHYCWSQFICREGKNRFEAFDFDSFRWIQLHFHPGKGRVVVSDIGYRRRSYPWQHEPRVTTSERPLQKLFAAAANTLRNCAQETLVDGMGRERQQYSGDCGHQLHAIHLLCGEARQSARFLATFSQGATLDGYFLDTWPAYDRLAREPAATTDNPVGAVAGLRRAICFRLLASLSLHRSDGRFAGTVSALGPVCALPAWLGARRRNAAGRKPRHAGGLDRVGWRLSPAATQAMRVQSLRRWHDGARIRADRPLVWRR